MYPSLKSRVVKSSSVCSTVGAVQTEGGRGKYHTYDDYNLERAMAAVDEGNSFRRAAEMYGVPRATLHDHYRGRHDNGKAGPRPFLSFGEEEELVVFLELHAKIGYPYTRKQVLQIVQDIVTTKGIEAEVSSGWWDSFCRRHPSVVLRSAMPLSLSRAHATDPAVLNAYYDKLEEILKSNKILDKAGSIFNCDESGFSLSPKSPKVVCSAGMKAVSHITGDTKTQVTVLACTNASGYVLPPFIIFDRKTLNPQLTVGEVAGTIYGLSNKGWIDKGLFSYWFLNHFLMYAPAARPLLLILDGHSSHYCPEIIRVAMEQDIIIFTLPPNTTHITQPLDKGVFGPLKSAWKNVCFKFLASNPGKCITRYEFSELFSKAWSQSMAIRNVTASFRATGICPFNRKATIIKQFEPSDMMKDSKVKYHPMYSPQLKSKGVRDIPSHDSNHDDSYASDTDGSSDTDRCVTPFPDIPKFGNHLKDYKIPELPKLRKAKETGRVLTSAENFQRLQEKDRIKKEKLLEKERKQKIREEKKIAKLCKKIADKDKIPITRGQGRDRKKTSKLLNMQLSKIYQ